MPFGDGRELGLVLTPHLDLSRCPHCATANPSISFRHSFAARPKKLSLAQKTNGCELIWYVYVCESCAGLVGAATQLMPGIQRPSDGAAPSAIPGVRPNLNDWLVPIPRTTSPDVPERVASRLRQAEETLASPTPSIMTSAAAVDAMLKEKGLKDGSLYARIGQAVAQAIITADMAEWAHDVRLDANDERHADESVNEPTPEDAQRCFDFASTLAELLFVLPARVRRGRTPPKAP